MADPVFPFPPKNQQKYFSDPAAMILPKKLGHNLKKILPFFEEMKTKQSAAEIFWPLGCKYSGCFKSFRLF